MLDERAVLNDIFVGRPRGPRARASMVRRPVACAPRLVRGVAQRGIRDLFRACLAGEAPRARRIRVRYQGRSRGLCIRGARALSAADRFCQDYDAPLDLFDRHLYEKGGLVLHALRVELGDELFWRGVGSYLTKNARGIVETRDLQRALEDVSGRSLGALLRAVALQARAPGDRDRSLLGKRNPGDRDQTDAADRGRSASVVRVAARSRPRGRSRGGSTADDSARHGAAAVSSRLRRRSGPRSSSPIPRCESSVRRGSKCRVTCFVSSSRRRPPRAGAGSRRRRWRGSTILWPSRPWRDRCPTRTASGARARGVRVGARKNPRPRELRGAEEGAEHAAHPKVRRAVVEALGHFRTTEAMEALKPYALRDASYLVEAEAARALGRTRQPAALDVLVDLLDRSSWSDVLRVGAIDGLAALRDDRALPHLNAASALWPTATRAPRSHLESAEDRRRSKDARRHPSSSSTIRIPFCASTSFARSARWGTRKRGRRFASGSRSISTLACVVAFVRSLRDLTRTECELRTSCREELEKLQGEYADLEGPTRKGRGAVRQNSKEPA